MQLLGILLLLTFLIYANLAKEQSVRGWEEVEEEEEEEGEEEEEFRQENVDELNFPPKPDVEQKLRLASSVDELMSLIYPSYWAALKCRSKLSAVGSSGTSRLSQSPQPHYTRPTEPAFAAAFLNLDVLKSIESEWRKTHCTPREVCVDVGREFGASTNIFYKPPCVSVYRCGGCCHSEDKQCRNISTGYLSKTTNTNCFYSELFEITVPITQGTRPVTISVANHTQCSCLSKLDVFKQVHSIIRRALPECSSVNRTCPPGQVWSSRLCWCVSVPTKPPTPLLSASNSASKQQQQVFSSAICGPDKDLDIETCQCVCRRRDQDCGSERHWDRSTCQCVCNVRSNGASCPPNHVFNRDTCQCTCIKTCPKSQPLDKTKCSCQCNESPNKCFLRGRRFHQASCSCVRPPCDVRRRRCEPGLSFSEEVCRCVPSHWRRLD